MHLMEPDDALTAAARRVWEVGSATAATSGGTGRPNEEESDPWLPVRRPSPDDSTTPPGEPSDVSGSTPGRSESDSESLNSPPSEPPSRPSTPRYKRPTNALEFAAQANRVATAVLNGEINVDTARTYSAIARTVAQALSTEVVRSRFLHTAPDLSFPEDDDAAE